MSLREEQCKKVCRILDDVLANRPTERDSLIVAVRKAFESLEQFGNSEQLPSAQPERPSEIQDILDYLDTVLHPIVSPEHWNVYAELHDMISTLPSAERRGRWIIKKDVTFSHIICSECKKPFYGNMNDVWDYCPHCGAKMDLEYEDA